MTFIFTENCFRYFGSLNNCGGFFIFSEKSALQKSLTFVFPDRISFFSLNEKNPAYRQAGKQKESSQSHPSTRVMIFSFWRTSRNPRKKSFPPTSARATLTGLPCISPKGEVGDFINLNFCYFLRLLIFQVHSLTFIIFLILYSL